MGQESRVKNHSLVPLNGCWTGLSFRGNLVRKSKLHGLRSFDGVKMLQHQQDTMLFSSLRGTSSTVQRRSLSSDRETTKLPPQSKEDKKLVQLEEVRRGLEKILVPILRKNVIAGKNNTATWVFSDSVDNQVSVIRRGIRTYVQISSFLSAVKTSQIFTRYLNIEVEVEDIIEEIEDRNSDEANLLKLIRKCKTIKLKSDLPQEFNIRNTFLNVYREKLHSAEK